MKTFDIYSKENLENLVNDLFYYLYNKKSYRAKSNFSTYRNERLSDDIIVYTLNRRYYIDENNFSYKYKNVPIFMEENIDVTEWLEYYNDKTLTFSMDAILCEYLYYYDVEDCEIVAKKISNIFEKHGFYIDFGSSTIVFAWTKDDYPY